MNSKGNYRESPRTFILLKETKPEYRENSNPPKQPYYKKKKSEETKERK
jgi:hypothetical protein